MNRLTHKNKKGEWCIKNKYPDGIILVCSPEGDYYIGTPIDRLAELENAIECRQMVEIPCKIGDTIYVVPSKAVYGLNILHKFEKNNRIYKQVIDEVRITRRGWYLKTCDSMDTQVDSSLSETWFLTEAEAEAKLDELRKGEDVTFEEPTTNKEKQSESQTEGKHGKEINPITYKRISRRKHEIEYNDPLYRRLQELEDQLERGQLTKAPSKLAEIVDKFHIGSVDAVCGVGDMIYIPWVWFGQSGIAKVKITGMCIDDEGLRYCFNLDSDDERFIREYGELYSYHFGAKWFLDKAEAKARLEELKVEAE